MQLGYQSTREVRGWSGVLTWVRFAVIVFFQGVIIMLLLPTSGLMGDGWGMGLSAPSGKNRLEGQMGRF